MRSGPYVIDYFQKRRDGGKDTRQNDDDRSRDRPPDPGNDSRSESPSSPDHRRSLLARVAFDPHLLLDFFHLLLEFLRLSLQNGQGSGETNDGQNGDPVRVPQPAANRLAGALQDFQHAERSDDDGG